MQIQNDIAIMGGAGAGKSTIAEYLEREYDYVRIPVAKTLKEAAVRVWGPDAARDRRILQALGVHIREIDPDALINNCIREIGESEQASVVDDLRYPNEYWALKERGFVFLRCLAREELRVDRLLRTGKLDDTSQLQDETETALVGLEATGQGIVDDFTVFNEDGHEDLFRQVEGVLYHLQEAE